MTDAEKIGQDQSEDLAVAEVEFGHRNRGGEMFGDRDKVSC